MRTPALPPRGGLTRSAERPALRGKGASALAHGVFDVIGAATCPRSARCGSVGAAAQRRAMPAEQGAQRGQSEVDAALLCGRAGPRAVAVAANDIHRRGGSRDWRLARPTAIAGRDLLALARAHSAGGCSRCCLCPDATVPGGNAEDVSSGLGVRRGGRVAAGVFLRACRRVSQNPPLGG